MPDPLPSDIVARLRSDSTAALAASLILAGSFPDIVSWALRAFSKSGDLKPSMPTDGGKNRRATKSKPAAKSDQALLAVMRANPDASLADLIRLGRRPRARRPSPRSSGSRRRGSSSIPVRASTG